MDLEIKKEVVKVYKDQNCDFLGVDSLCSEHVKERKDQCIQFINKYNDLKKFYNYLVNHPDIIEELENIKEHEKKKKEKKEKKGNLELIDYQFTNGNELREFNITPDGKWLIACHQNSNDTVVYQIKADGTLNETYRTKCIKTPVCVTYLH